MKYLNYPIYYLQMSDFNSNGDIINPDIPKDVPVMIMIQGNFCGYCTQSKPEYQTFANKNINRVFTTTIQADGTEEGEKELGDIVKTIDSTFQGYPHYIAYYNGKRYTHTGGRSAEDLEKFISTL